MPQGFLVYTNFLREHRTTKPPDEDIARIQVQCSKAENITLPELVDIISQGGTCRMCAIDGNTDDAFISGQCFALDFDNIEYININGKRQKRPLPPSKLHGATFSINKATEKGMPPFCCYPTFSNNRPPYNVERFRLLFVIDRPLFDSEQWRHVMRKIRSCFPEYATDASCLNPSKLFFGTDQGIVYTDYKAVLSADRLLADYVPPKATEAPQKPQKPPRSPRRHTNGSGTMKAVEAIRKHDANYLRRKLGRNQKTVFDNRADFFSFIYRKINLAKLLEVEERKPFSCILPSHGSQDEHPSASVFRETRFSSGTWQYKCFSENKTLNVKQLIELLGDFDSEYKALEFLKSVYNLEIRKTAWAIEQEENIDQIIDCITRTDEYGFRMICPTANYTTRNCQQLFIRILCIARSCIYPERTSKSGNIIFFMSIRQLAKASGKGSIDKVNKYLKLLLYHGLIETVPDEAVPKAFLKKALEGRKNGHNHVTFFSIPSWVYKTTQAIEAQGQKWKANNYRINAISYEVFYRTEGAEIAGKLYPQTAHYTDQKGQKHQKKTGRKADQRHQQIAAAVLEAIETKGFCTEQEVISTLGIMGTVAADTQVKRSMTDILNTYGLRKVRASKALKQRFCIDSKGYPSIIIPK